MPAESTVLSLESEKADVMSAGGGRIEGFRFSVTDFQVVCRPDIVVVILSLRFEYIIVAADVVPDAADSGSKLLDLSKEIRVAGFERESDKLVYTGQQVRQNLRVYYKENLLTEKTAASSASAEPSAVWSVSASASFLGKKGTVAAE